MVAGVRSNWTKISIMGHYIRCRSCCVRRILYCLLRCKSPKRWSDDIGQVDLFLMKKNSHKPVIKVSPEVKATVLRSFRSSGEQLRDGTATTVRRRCQAVCHDDITWACHGAEVTTTTDVILVWHIATSLFELRYSSPTSASSSSSTPPAANTMLVAGSLSRYCMYLVAKAPDLLPDNSAWTKGRYEAVKKSVEAVWRSGAVPLSADSFGGERSHEVLRKGSRLAKQLMEEAKRRTPEEGDQTAEAWGGKDEVWQFLAEFWSEMVLYLASSDNVKGHIEALQRGGELITLLWALLLHAGITARPARDAPEP